MKNHALSLVGPVQVPLVDFCSPCLCFSLNWDTGDLASGSGTHCNALCLFHRMDGVQVHQDWFMVAMSCSVLAGISSTL